MENADDPKNQNNAQPPANSNNETYGKYIDPDYKKKQQKKKALLIIALSVGGLIFIAIFVILAATLFSNSKGDSTTPSEKTVNVIETCEDEECFTQRFSLCQPSKYKESEGGNTVEYEIPGIHDVGCIVSLKYINNDDEEIVGKEMTCDFDNDIDFYSSAELVFANPADFECEGSLVEYL
jgi:hypothetical protein